jgi:sec-independent protein translocase protein TatA
MIPFAVLSFANMGGWEWIVVLVLVLIFFGAGKLPQVFSQFGKAAKAFRDGAKGDEVDVTPKLDGSRISEADEVRTKAKETA